MLDKFVQLMSNIERLKADRCIQPVSYIDLYNSVNNNQVIGGLEFSFDGVTLPVNGSDLIIEDTTLNVSIIGAYNSGDEFIKITGLESSDIIIYEDNVWNDELSYTLPDSFNYNVIEGLEEQSVLAASIELTIPEHEETICDLANEINNNIGNNLWINSNTGSDFNDGTTKTNAFQTLDKVLRVLNNNKTCNNVITVHFAPGDYSNDINTLNTFNKIEFIGDINNPGDEINITTNTPIIIYNSENLVFRNLKFINGTDTIDYNGLCLVLQNCDNAEISDCIFNHTGAAYDLNDVSLLSLINSNSIISDSEFSYENVQTSTDIGAGAIRLFNSFITWNNINVTCNNLQHLIINNEGWAYFNKEILTNNDALPSEPKNTIGWYNNAIESSNKTVTDIIYGDEPTEAESMAQPTKLFLWGED
jgi:hypothetical protein